jgi:hypothetical protein
MPKHLVRFDGEPLFDLSSYARQGSSGRDHLSPEQFEQITLTVRRAPEMMVKVLTRGGQDLKAIRGHLSYLNRGGDLAIETDDGERVKGEGVESDLLSEWDLELKEDRRRSQLGPREDRAPPKLVHKLVFSMPPGTPPYRANLRGDSTHMRERAEAVARGLSQGGGRVEPVKARLVETRNMVRRGWWAVSEILMRDKQPELAAQVTRFAEQMRPPMTEREWLAAKLVERIRPARARLGLGCLAAREPLAEHRRR